MNIIIKAKNLEIDEKLKSVINHKIGSLKKLMDKEKAIEQSQSFLSIPNLVFLDTNKKVFHCQAVDILFSNIECLNKLFNLNHFSFHNFFQNDNLMLPVLYLNFAFQLMLKTFFKCFSTNSLLYG